MLTTVIPRLISLQPIARALGGRNGAFAAALSAALLAAATMLLPACGDDDDGPTPSGCTDDFCAPYVQPTSPENVLRNLKLAYESRDAEMYELGFAPEYIFEFSPDDVVQGNTPANWPLADELDSARNMFEDESVDRVEMTSFTIPAARPAVASDNLPTIVGIQVVTIDAARLSVFTRNEQGEVLELLVPGEECVFFLKQDVVDGEQRWRIVRWRDKPFGGLAAAGPATEETSWGAIKNLYN